MKQALLPVGQAEVILHPGKLKTIFHLLICLGFSVPIAVIGPGPGERGMWLVAAIFGLGAIVFIVQLIPGVSYLKLSPEGFTWRSLFRTWPTTAWKDVSEFRVGDKMVIYDADGPSNPTLRKINTALVGATHGLPETYGLKAQELAEIMNIWRYRNTIQE